MDTESELSILMLIFFLSQDLVSFRSFFVREFQMDGMYTEFSESVQIVVE